MNLHPGYLASYQQGSSATTLNANSISGQCHSVKYSILITFLSKECILPSSDQVSLGLTGGVCCYTMVPFASLYS